MHVLVSLRLLHLRTNILINKFQLCSQVSCNFLDVEIMCVYIYLCIHMHIVCIKQFLKIPFFSKMSLIYWTAFTLFFVFMYYILFHLFDLLLGQIFFLLFNVFYHSFYISFLFDDLSTSLPFNFQFLKHCYYFCRYYSYLVFL